MSRELQHDALLDKLRNGFPCKGDDGRVRRVVVRDRYIAIHDGALATYVWFNSDGQIVGGSTPPSEG